MEDLGGKLVLKKPGKKSGVVTSVDLSRLCWTVGSTLMEILTYGRLYGDDTNDYTGMIRTTIPAFVLEHTGK